jgi:hypothetical protein
LCSTCGGHFQVHWCLQVLALRRPPLLVVSAQGMECLVVFVVAIVGWCNLFCRAEPRTAFVVNLPFSVNEIQLRDLFAKVRLTIVPLLFLLFGSSLLHIYRFSMVLLKRSALSKTKMASLRDTHMWNSPRRSVPLLWVLNSTSLFAWCWMRVGERAIFFGVARSWISWAYIESIYFCSACTKWSSRLSWQQYYLCIEFASDNHRTNPQKHFRFCMSSYRSFHFWLYAHP